ncbi:hypothetical protein ABNC50_13680 [Paenibacillus larvae]
MRVIAYGSSMFIPVGDVGLDKYPTEKLIGVVEIFHLVVQHLQEDYQIFAILSF